MTRRLTIHQQTPVQSRPSTSTTPGADGDITTFEDGGGAYHDERLAEEQRAAAAVLPLILGLVVTQRVVLQGHPAVLPAVDVVGPLGRQESATPRQHSRKP